MRRLREMDSGRDESQGDIEAGIHLGPPVTLVNSSGMPTSENDIGLGLRGLPLPDRTSSSEFSPPIQFSEEANSHSENDDRSDASSTSERTDSLSKGLDDNELSKDELRDEVLQYLQRATIDEAYGDTLSGSRTRRYEPKWPMEFKVPEPPLLEPASQQEADAIFNKLLYPLRGWHRLPEDEHTTWESHNRRRQILSTFKLHREFRKAQPPPPDSLAGNFLLYRNLPDSALEVNVWSSINAAHIAIRRDDWDVADRRITRALIAASKLRYGPLIAKCWYWRGVIADGLGDRQTAADCFLSAMRCVGVYQEGELMSTVVVAYKLDLLDLLDEKDSNEGENTWTRQVRRAILGIDPWFRPAGEILCKPSLTSTIPSSPALSLRDCVEEGMNAVEASWPREVEWAHVERLEKAAQSSSYARKEMIYRICVGFSPYFESAIRGEKFYNNFDNYPDIEETTAWKVLRYSKTKAGLRKLSEAKSAPESTSEVPLDRSVEGTGQPRQDGSTDNTGAFVGQQSEGAKRGRSLTIDTAKANAADNPSKTLEDLRREITAEEKLAAYEHGLLHLFDDENKSIRRQELEADEEWINDIREQQATFDHSVEQELSKPDVSPREARLRVRQRNEDYRREIWGSDGVRSPTLSLTRRAREQEHDHVQVACRQHFKAELTYMDYRRKYRAYVRLPADRREQITEPAQPVATLAWLDQAAGKFASQTNSQISNFAEGRSPEREASPEHVESRSDSPPRRATSLIPPLRFHQHTSPSISDSPSAICDPAASTNTNNKTDKDLNPTPHGPISRAMECKIALDAMSKLMEQARTQDKVLSVERLVEHAERTISELTSLADLDGFLTACARRSLDNDDHHHRRQDYHRGVSNPSSVGNDSARKETDPANNDDWEDDDDDDGSEEEATNTVPNPPHLDNRWIANEDNDNPNPDDPDVPDSAADDWVDDDDEEDETF